MRRLVVSGGLLLGMVGSSFLTAATADAFHSDNGECRCSASIGFSRPELQWRDGILTFIPRVDVTIRSRGSFEAPSWTATVEYSGKTSYGSDDTTVPAGVVFSGSQAIARAPCGSRYSLRGVQLPAVTLEGLTRTLPGPREELDGTVEMSAAVSGCGFDTEKKMARFTMEQFGNLIVRGWRSVR